MRKTVCLRVFTTLHNIYLFNLQKLRGLIIMFEPYIKMPHVIRRIRQYKFKYLLDEYAAYMISRRYAVDHMRQNRTAAEHFVFWLQSQKLLSPVKVDEPLIQKFINKHIPICKCPKPAPRYRPMLYSALNIFLRMQQVGVQEEKVSTSEIDIVLDKFDDYLVRVCGLARNTRLYHQRHLKIFLKGFFSDDKVRLDRLDPSNVRDFLYDNIQHYKRRTFGLFVYSLRSFFKYLQFKGIGNPWLIASLPKIIEWKSAALPEYLNEAEVAKFLSAFDRTTALGKRDYAMMICMMELGLRGQEVASLKLEDINWRTHTLCLPRGKTRQSYVLPITQKLMNAIVEYLQHGRPQTSSRQAFVYHRAPVGVGIIPKTVTEVVRRACNRVGLTPVSPGTHLLRKTFATNLLNNGATIKEVADLLRHRSINTTAIYTKVNFPKLIQVALPWVEELA
jgi:integrase/recombinase XerD